MKKKVLISEKKKKTVIKKCKPKFKKIHRQYTEIEYFFIEEMIKNIYMIYTLI